MDEIRAGRGAAKRGLRVQVGRRRTGRQRRRGSAEAITTGKPCRTTGRRASVALRCPGYSSFVASSPPIAESQTGSTRSKRGVSALRVAKAETHEGDNRPGSVAGQADRELRSRGKARTDAPLSTLFPTPSRRARKRDTARRRHTRHSHSRLSPTTFLQGPDQNRRVGCDTKADPVSKEERNTCISKQS